MARKRIKRKGDSYLRDGLILLAVAVVFAVILGGVFFKTKKPLIMRRKLLSWQAMKMCLQVMKE